MYGGLGGLSNSIPIHFTYIHMYVHMHVNSIINICTYVHMYSIQTYARYMIDTRRVEKFSYLFALVKHGNQILVLIHSYDRIQYPYFASQPYRIYCTHRFACIKCGAFCSKRRAMMGQRQYEFKSNLHPPFALSTFHLLRSCNRLILSNSGQLIMPESTELQSATYYNAKAALTNVTQSNMNYTLDMLNSAQSAASDEAINVLDEEQENTTCTTAAPATQSRLPTMASTDNANDCDKSSESFRHRFEMDCRAGALGKTPLPAFEYIAPAKPAFHLTSLPPIFDVHRLPGIFPNFIQRRTRGEKRIIPDELKDDKYFERRKRNNEAAKKSRDARKIREDRNAFRAALLEQENSILRAQVLALRDELTTLKQLIATTTTTMTLNTSNPSEKDRL